MHAFIFMSETRFIIRDYEAIKKLILQSNLQLAVNVK